MRWLAILVLFVLGCGEPSGPPSVSGGIDGPIDGTIGRGGPSNSGTGGFGGAGGSGGQAAGACNNDLDFRALTGSGGVREVARDCGVFRCLGSLEDSGRYEGCVSACVENDIPGISTGCASCYGEIERCGLDSFCRLRCQNDTCSPMCLSCLDNAGCLSAFETCTGLLSVECG